MDQGVGGDVHWGESFGPYVFEDPECGRVDGKRDFRISSRWQVNLPLLRGWAVRSPLAYCLIVDCR